ncbi:MAG TPA: hypothetical protein PK230_02300, partial [Chitinophagales bacterium]|nr:hypothetical protein [Chitinophagales bacterium]
MRKRIKELTISRDLWKAKYKTSGLSQANSDVLMDEKADRHQYGSSLVCLLLEMQKYGAMSLRSCRNSVACMLVALGLSVRLPSHSTIRNWLCKGGLHRIKTTESVGGEYVVYVDESIVFGSEKILL